MVYKFSDKKSEGSRVVNNKENMKLAEERHKPIIKKKLKKETFILHLEIIFGLLI